MTSTCVRLLLLLVLATGPLAATAMAGAASPVWSGVPGDEPADVPDRAPDGETASEESTPEEATLGTVASLAATASPWQYRLWSRRAPVPPLTGDPTPPPEAV